MMFQENIESFGVLLKGRSLSHLPRYAHKFNDCFIVNDFKEEIESFGDCIQGKNISHFVNKSKHARLHVKQYNSLNIDKIQAYQVFNILNLGHLVMWIRYKMIKKELRWLPERLLAFNKSFGPEFQRKFPNTGLLSIIYTLEIIKPQELWVLGLDFYKADYLFRREYHETLTPQINKFDQLGLVDFMANIFALYPETHINLVTVYKEFPDVKNVKKIIVDC